MKFLKNPLIAGIIGVVIGAKFASKVNGLPLVNKIPG
jgi:hypothetical protein